MILAVLLALDGVRGVTSILDVPLLESPPMPLSEMAENVITLRSPDARHTDLVKDAMVDKFPPCAYTAITTMVAFGSLTPSEIVPVMDFGWIMCAGIICGRIIVLDCRHWGKSSQSR